MPETLFEKSGNATKWSPPTRRRSFISIAISCTRSRARKRLRGCGWRRRKVRRPDLTFATVDHNVPTENQLDIREPMSRRQVETLRANCREFGVTLYDIEQRPPRDRPRHRAGAGPDAARPDDRLRRQPHQHPRRIRGAGVRDRHERGRACSGDADALARSPAALVRSRGHGQRSPRGPGAEGHHPRRHPRDRHRRGDGARSRVLRAGDLRTFDGRPDDGLQHVDRGRRPGRLDRPRRHDDPVPHARRPPVRPQGRGARSRPRRLENAPHRRPLGV